MGSADTDLAITLDGEEVRAPAGEVVTIGRDPASTVRATGRSVSRRHAVIHFTDGSWLLEDAGSSFGTWVGDRPVDRVPITDAVRVRLGDALGGQTLEVRRRPTPVPVPAPEPEPEVVEEPAVAAVGPSDQVVPIGQVPPRMPNGSTADTRRCTECRAVMPPSQEWCEICGAHVDPLPVVAEPAEPEVDQPVHAGVAIDLAEDHLDLVPGHDATAHLHVRNHGVIVDRFDVSLTGDAAQWSVIDPATLVLWPGSSGEAVITFRPPRHPSVGHGRSVVGVVAASQTDRTVSATDQATVTVAPFYDLDVKLLPQAIRAVGRATFLLALDNRGNAALDLGIEVTDLTDILDVEVTPRVELAPGDREEVPILLAPRTDVRGPAAQPRSFNVTVRSPQGPGAELSGTLLQEPVVEPPPPVDPTPAPSPVPEPAETAAGAKLLSRLTIEPVALIGALVAVIGALLSRDELDRWDDDAENVLAGAAVWAVVALVAFVAGVLSLVPRTKVIRRLTGLGLLGVAAGIVADISPSSVRDLTTGVVALAIGGLLLLFSP